MKISKRRGRWVVDAYIHGRRVVRSFQTKREAEDRKAELKDECDAKLEPAVDGFITLRDYAQLFLKDCRDAQLAPASMRLYTFMLEKHIVPELGDLQIRELRRPRIRTFLQGLGGKGTRTASRAVLSGILAMAVDDQIITANPARDLIRRRRVKAKAAGECARDVKAMSRNQRDRFLAAAGGEPELYTASLIGFLAGLRGGEALGLQWDAVDFTAHQLRVHRQLLSDTTKSGKERLVDMAAPLVAHLEALHSCRRAEAFHRGEPMSPWVVCAWLPEKPTDTEGQRAHRRIRRAMIRTLKAAELPPHLTFHSTRHTYCSLLVAAGVSPVYVAQQAGHGDVSFTVKVYGNWFPVEQPGAVDAMAAGLPLALPVTKQAPTGNSPSAAHPQPPSSTGTCADQNPGIALSW